MKYGVLGFWGFGGVGGICGISCSRFDSSLDRSRSSEWGIDFVLYCVIKDRIFSFIIWLLLFYIKYINILYIHMDICYKIIYIYIYIAMVLVSIFYNKFNNFNIYSILTIYIC